MGNLLHVYEYPVGDTVADTAASVSYTYDDLNRVETETSVGVTHTYSYDLNGNRRSANYGVTDRDVVWTYDALNRIETIVEGEAPNVHTTTYRYDLNSKPVYREYPSGVKETRVFDAMGRLESMTTTDSSLDELVVLTYRYDAVGSALRMEQTSDETFGDEVPGTATTKWTYDDRYRLSTETLAAGGVVTEITYTWDDADNRKTKKVKVDAVDEESVTYTFNALNQMERWSRVADGDYDWAIYRYDGNGNRGSKVTAPFDGEMTLTRYEYDGDNRLLKTSKHTRDCYQYCVNTMECWHCTGSGECPDYGYQPPCDEGCSGYKDCIYCMGTGFCHDCDVDYYHSQWTALGIEHEFKYDYRSRRYYRDVSGGSNPETTYHVFDGGLSVQEYTELPTTENASPETEFIRGEGMGGGVGGMVYSIKDDGSGNDVIIASHANHRGDVIVADQIDAVERYQIKTV